MKSFAILAIFLFGLSLIHSRQVARLQADDCLKCVDDIVNAVEDCQVRNEKKLYQIIVMPKS